MYLADVDEFASAMGCTTRPVPTMLIKVDRLLVAIFHVPHISRTTTFKDDRQAAFSIQVP